MTPDPKTIQAGLGAIEKLLKINWKEHFKTARWKVTPSIDISFDEKGKLLHDFKAIQKLSNRLFRPTYKEYLKLIKISFKEDEDLIKHLKKKKMAAPELKKIELYLADRQQRKDQIVRSIEILYDPATLKALNLCINLAEVEKILFSFLSDVQCGFKTPEGTKFDVHMNIESRQVSVPIWLNDEEVGHLRAAYPAVRDNRGFAIPDMFDFNVLPRDVIISKFYPLLIWLCTRWKPEFVEKHRLTLFNPSFWSIGLG